MAMEITKRWYVGGGKAGIMRLKNLQLLADLHYRGNVSRLVNETLDKMWKLDPKTGRPLKDQTTK